MAGGYLIAWVVAKGNSLNTIRKRDRRPFLQLTGKWKHHGRELFAAAFEESDAILKNSIANMLLACLFFLLSPVLFVFINQQVIARHIAYSKLAPYRETASTKGCFLCLEWGRNKIPLGGGGC